MFTNEHCVFLANFLKHEYQLANEAVISQYDPARSRHIAGLSRLLASRLEDDNPEFDRDLFLKEIGITD